LRAPRYSQWGRACPLRLAASPGAAAPGGRVKAREINGFLLAVKRAQNASSFRDAPPWRGPGIHNHGPGLWIPGSPSSGRASRGPVGGAPE
jgi:hypothetical protein